LLSYCLHKIGGKEEKKIKATGRYRRNYYKLLYELKETRGWCKLKEEPLDGTVWRTGFGRRCGTDVRLWNE
jgi:hypothetical protein